MNVLQKIDGSISSPSTPNCSAGGCSSISSISNSNNSNNNNRINSAAYTPLSTTPNSHHQHHPQHQHQSPSQQLGNKGVGVGVGVPPVPPAAESNAGSGSTSGHKNSLKGTKLARRARSFKDDLIEKISLMRTPNNTLGRSHSPHSPRNKHALKPPPTTEEVQKSTQTLETHVKDIYNATKHFRDVISKKKLEVLPGNGTIIIETIASLYSVIQSYTLNENSAIMSSATRQVYQSLGKLIKLCDEVMLTKEDVECASLSDENVREVIDLLEEAVRNLVTLAQTKLKEQDQCTFRYSGSGLSGIGAAADIMGTVTAAATTGTATMRPPVDAVVQRTSLPDIALTPKERDILEQSNTNPIRASHSTESILRDTSPPPKPPLPNRSSNPPPLPPKRRSQPSQASPQPYQQSHNMSVNSDLDCSSNFSLMSCGVDRCSLSVRSRSPDENSSQCSFDSALNHSREDEQHQHLHQQQQPQKQPTQQQLEDAQLLEDDVDKMISYTSQSDANTATANVDTVALQQQEEAATQPPAAGTLINASGEGSGGECNTELRKVAAALTSNRHSNESGFVSMKSFRTSTQSVSKRSSDHSVQSSTKSSSSNSEIAFGISETTTTASSTTTAAVTSSTRSSEYHQHYQSSVQRQSAATTTTTSLANNICNMNSSSTTTMSTTATSSYSELEHSSLNASPEHNHSKLLSGRAIAPALPPKSLTRQPTLCGAADERDDTTSELALLRHMPSHTPFKFSSELDPWHAKHHSLSGPPLSARLVTSCTIDRHMDDPPPLPMKKKHILAYMEICSASTRNVEHRHTVHAYNLNVQRNLSHSQTMNIMPMSKELSPEHETPPALPPKNYKQRKPSALPPTIITTPPPSPKPTHLSGASDGHGDVSIGSRNSRMTTVSEELSDAMPAENDDDDAVADMMPGHENVGSGQVHYCHSHQLPSEANVSPGRDESVTPISTPKLEEDDQEHEEEQEDENDVDEQLPNMLEVIDITPYLILKKTEEEGPEVKGGFIDALIVHASRASARSDNAFSEAFITTFRTFIQPIDVIEKLTHRYTYFFCQMQDQKQKAAKETFSLLVRVVNDLTLSDLSSELLSLLVEFVYQLVCSGELYMAKVLRIKFVEKVTYKNQQTAEKALHPCNDKPTHQQLSLLDLKSLEIAEQMTLLDAELFQKIEIPEVLLFAKDQCEEKSPNLNKFTEHFNKMSYWARSKILQLSDAKEREKHVNKFIKIMKHLRKMNNYNSYLALLSALDSSPIRRLEWQKGTAEEVRSFCALIDSSSSFRAYRQALADTQPPCIPYIGLVLQDLTFVHVGNQDYMAKGVINFSKRWQQYNIIVNMKRFKKCAYPFRRNERIISFFDNFNEFIGEEEMWQISEKIKPRGRRPVNY
ncbi:guanine nucleotide-releasing factor 2 isoform X2 [Scaptodrosophila lebanonensis]|uniref:CRK SH3-binding GNRP n=1 Tax=Drosophila lebanonensis TaxID=7225 RepID=A0A6J2TZ03_DROLE|nr:guanine nucleotide-releasing factor 2 isoform X2 [Scaptodrosophila lebanonensis]